MTMWLTFEKTGMTVTYSNDVDFKHHLLQFADWWRVDNTVANTNVCC